MHAVIQTGGKQYRVAVGDRLRVESLGVEPGDQIELDKVLMICDQGNNQVGTPILEGASVSVQVINNGRGKKIKIVKMKRRQGYRRTQGHRQNYTEIEVTAIGEKVAKAKPVKKATLDTPGNKPEPVNKSEAEDDLTKINGIGPVIAGKLEKIGYKTLAQIAELDDEAITKIEEQLSFKGRVERENWIAQAKELVS